MGHPAQFNSISTDRRAILYERLEQAKWAITLTSYRVDKIAKISHRLYIMNSMTNK